jgi:hypothetical protein
MEKYYTPEEDELHDGMMVEIDPHGDESWEPFKVILRVNGYFISNHLKRKHLRVKHLDREDIEGEGFTEDKLFLDISVKHGMEVYHKEVEHRGEVKNLMLVYTGQMIETLSLICLL